MPLAPEFIRHRSMAGSRHDQKEIDPYALDNSEEDDEEEEVRRNHEREEGPAAAVTETPSTRTTSAPTENAESSSHGVQSFPSSEETVSSSGSTSAKHRESTKAMSETEFARLPPPPPIPEVPPPWLLKGDVYLFGFWTSSSMASKMPRKAFSPLEEQSSFAHESSGKPCGGMSMIQIIRYYESPVGPYDEFIIAPGSWTWAKETQGGKRVKGANARISRIYVSQKHTCFNGRKNWNVPKHLAKFDWTQNPDGSTTVQIFPMDTNRKYASNSQANPTSTVLESEYSSTPFFRTTFKPMSYVPTVPFAVHWLKYVGINPLLVQPPVPAGNGSLGELAGTDKWCSVMPLQSSKKCKLGWMDLQQYDGATRKSSRKSQSDPSHNNDQTGPEHASPSQPDETASQANSDTSEGGCREGREENFWPGLGRWQLAVKMEGANIIFDDPLDIWDAPSSNL